MLGRPWRAEPGVEAGPGWLLGDSGKGLLDSYEPERRTHALDTIDFSVRLGRMVCVTDEAEAVARDAVLAAESTPDRPVSRPLRTGLLHRTVGTVAAPPTGSLTPQGRVRRFRGVDPRLRRRGATSG